MTLVLAIDDSLTIRLLLRQVIETAGFTCVTAGDGVEGLERFAEHAPDLVITDLNMPRMDGFGVIGAIRAGASHARVPILVLSTENAEVLRARARAAGATGWLTKPFEDSVLIPILRRFLGGGAAG